VNCLEFERLLDSGAPAELPATALEHARDCAGCTRSLARARSLEHHLERAFSAEHGAPVTGTPAGDALPPAFTAAVMARVARGEARGVRWIAQPDLVPWWARVAAEPAVALACGVAALLLWKGDALLASVRAWIPGAMAAPARLEELTAGNSIVTWAQTLTHALVPGPQAHWTVVAAMFIGIAPLFLMLGWLMWRACDRLAGPAGTSSSRQGGFTTV